ncbi:hypothetical protein [Vibrio crassostreae]|uniref:hypothetical protein n=1 Tax=Vibrio crassostreae TaxID=246167 RepID=UPI001B3091BF|nr:hypothetical protein [Vibrio crassostreae]
MSKKKKHDHIIAKTQLVFVAAILLQMFASNLLLESLGKEPIFVPPSLSFSSTLEDKQSGNFGFLYKE